MGLAVQDLPDDIDELKSLVIAKQEAIDIRDFRITRIERELAWAEEKYRAMELRYFGRKSEKYSPEEDRQNRLFDEAEAYQAPDAPPVVETIEVPAHDRAKRGRKPKSDKLPVREVLHELGSEEQQCPCCGEARTVIGEERSSEYHLVPAHVEKIVHVRMKYGPCTCESFAEAEEPEVIAAPGPAKIIPRSDFSNQTIAFFVAAKYADAIPYYRMAKMLRRSGLEVSRQTLCNLAIGVAKAINGLTEAMQADLARSPVILMDETTLQVLREGAGPPGKSYMWAMRGFLDGSPIQRFVYHASRSGKFADVLLEGFSGYLQTDGYVGYDHLDSRPGIEHVGCFAHIRRKFVEAWETAGKTGRAKEAVDLIARIYAIESRLRKQFNIGNLDGSGFVAKRKAQIETVVLEFRMWLQDRLLDTAPQSGLGKAVSYTLKILARASRFVEHELLTPDTNAIENSIRPFVVGRKNWLFSGSPLGAHASAALYSLIETAKANGHEPYAYLCHLFECLPTCKSSAEVLALLPYRLKPEDYSVTR